MNTRDYLKVLLAEPEPNQELSYYDSMIHDLYGAHMKYYERRGESYAELADYEVAISEIVKQAKKSKRVSRHDFAGFVLYLKENGING